VKTSKSAKISKSPAAKKAAVKPQPAHQLVTNPVDDLLQFMQAHGVDVTWHKIVSQSPNSPDQLSVTVAHGVFDVTPKGNTITRPTLAEALTELKQQIENAENNVPNAPQVAGGTGSTVTQSA
jgi:copper homeostasis protein CutC